LLRYIESDSEFINFYVSVAKAEAVMDTTSYYFTQAGSQSNKIRVVQHSASHSRPSHYNDPANHTFWPGENSTELNVQDGTLQNRSS